MQGVQPLLLVAKLHAPIDMHERESPHLLVVLICQLLLLALVAPAQLLCSSILCLFGLRGVSAALRLEPQRFRERQLLLLNLYTPTSQQLQRDALCPNLSAICRGRP